MTSRLRIVFNLKGMDYEYVPVNLLKAEHKTEEHKKMNPMGQVYSWSQCSTTPTDSRPT